MTQFVDVYLPERILGYGFRSKTITSTDITKVKSGRERRNRNWKHPLRQYSSPEGVRCWGDVASLMEMFLALGGPLYTFAFRDPLDFASVRLDYPNIEPQTSLIDQVIGVGDGNTTEFQLLKTYSYGSREYVREIYHPVLDSVEIGFNAMEGDNVLLPGGPYTWEVSRATGIVTISPAPSNGIILTWGGLFDVEVRFEGDDSLDNVIEAWTAAGFAEIAFEEVRPC